MSFNKPKKEQMKHNLNLLLACLFVFGMVSCNENEVDVKEQKVDVTYSTIIDDGAIENVGARATGTKADVGPVYNRGTAKVYTKGLHVRVFDPGNGTAYQDDFFEFDAGNGQGLPLKSKVKIGYNNFYAMTEPAVDPVMMVVDTIPKKYAPTTTSLATQYATYLNILKPIYALMDCDVSNEEILFNGTNEVDFYLEHLYGRVNIIFENNSGLDIYTELEARNSHVSNDFDDEWPTAGEVEVFGYIANDNRVVDGNKITINLYGSHPDVSGEMQLNEEPIEIMCETAVVKTVIIRINESLGKTMVTYNVTYQDFVSVNNLIEVN